MYEKKHVLREFTGKPHRTDHHRHGLGADQTGYGRGHLHRPAGPGGDFAGGVRFKKSVVRGFFQSRSFKERNGYRGDRPNPASRRGNLQPEDRNRHRGTHGERLGGAVGGAAAALCH
ncbi:hypothetical protein SDC9_152226 [bioreactor metagenome]|uniref:Uncharacterized protein n=1 Tax=bioreactor metagenome TaxID=1076179 RepID=A0A645ET17_9ZZZZ